MNDFETRFLLAGKVIGVHGIRGVLKFHSYVDHGLLTPDNTLFYRAADHEIHRVSILSITPHKRIYLITLEGIKDRNQATAFVNTDMYIEKTALPELDEETYYWFQIQGLEVVDISGAHIGYIRSIMETGSNDVYIIEHNGEEYLIPAITSAVKSVDLNQKQMVVDHEQMIDY